jgi:hypothetical protein
MPKFRLRSDAQPVTILARPGAPDAFEVEPGQVVDVPGQLVTSRDGKKGEAVEPLPSDAYLVVHGGDERAWPHALWESVDDKPAAPAVKEK